MRSFKKKEVKERHDEPKKMDMLLNLVPPDVAKKILDSVVRIPNVIPKEARATVHVRPSRGTVSGLPESVSGIRFSTFVSDPAILPDLAWKEILIDNRAKYHFDKNLLVDADTARIIDSIEVMSIDEDAITGVPNMMTCQATIHVCHNCKEPIAVVAARGSAIPGDAQQGETVVHVCRGCGFARYCDERCAQRAWKLGHHLTCGHIRQRLHPAPQPTQDVSMAPSN